MKYVLIYILYIEFYYKYTLPDKRGNMSYQERRVVVSIISTVLINAIYSVYMLQRYPEASPYSVEIFHFWGSFFLILILVSVVAKILIYILFTIINAIATREEEAPITDERDKMIELKSTQTALYVFALGFVLAMVSLVFNTPPTGMFLILFAAGFGSDIASDIAQFVFYRRGF